jgi:hypothetical protein
MKMTDRPQHVNPALQKGSLSFKRVAYTLGFCVVAATLLGEVAHQTQSFADQFPNLRQQYPQYYAVLSPDDTRRDRCIVDAGRRMSAFHEDYVTRAVQVCDEADAMAKEADARFEAAKRRPR